MTQIKGPTGVAPDTEVSGISETTHATGVAEASFATAVEAAKQAQAATATAGIDQLANALQAGTISPDQALSALVEAAMAGAPTEQQDDLAALMRDLVANDPHFTALRDSLK